MRTINRRCSLTKIGLFLVGLASASWALADGPAGPSPERRKAWNNSKLITGPEPPLPYMLEKAFPVEFTGPISLNRIPETSTYLVLEQHGRVYSFDGSQSKPQSRLVADFNASPPPHSRLKELPARRIELFSLCFHPDFASNRFVYVCYITQGGGQDTDTHISRFELNAGQEPELLIDSEHKILICDGGGHNGCTLAFGNDGMLYISLGDLTSPTPPDALNTGQDISDLYASILRIDVDRVGDEAYEGGNYAIPEDNPFVDLEGARGEVYAYGLRNPFRMSFDPPTGDLWVGDVGWEAWEMVYRVRSGGNYGWAIKEGPGDVKDQTPGPTPILPADIALNHAEAASVTGGMVYRGQRHPDLYGTYIFGDWITRKFWAASFDASAVTGYREICMSSVKPICFETDQDGELLVLDYNAANTHGGIYRFVPNPAASQDRPEFPDQLSETGLYADVAAHRASEGVATYEINASMWKDGARAEYLLGLPGTTQAVFYQRPQTTFDWFTTRVELPVGAVLAKTYTLGTIPASDRPRRIETQISLKDPQGDWQFFTYRWSADGTDAELVPAEGEAADYEVQTEHGDMSAVRWQFASRTSCRVCHTPWVGEAMAFTETQLRHSASSIRRNSGPDSWQLLSEYGMIRFDRDPPPLDDRQFSGMVDPYDAHQSLDRRARSYLHVNCAHCHLFGGNASTHFDIGFEKPLTESNILDQAPMRGDLGIENAVVAAPGQAARSLLFYRMAKSGSGRMPHIGSRLTDVEGMHLIKQWLSQLPQDRDILASLDLLCAPAVSAARSQNAPSASARLDAAIELMKSTGGTVELAAAVAERRVPAELIPKIVDASRQAPLPVQELLEPFASPDQRIERLGEHFDTSALLQMNGDAARGARLFAEGVGTCSSCHRIGTEGKQVGPDLTKIAEKLKSKDAILESIVRPAKDIEEKYRAVSVLTVDGIVLVGNIVAQGQGQLSLCDANGKITLVSESDIEALKTLDTSLMPDQLLAPLTAQQAADLLAYLSSLK
jgi:putative heme-binding domain-containing protein